MHSCLSERSQLRPLGSRSASRSGARLLVAPFWQSGVPLPRIRAMRRPTTVPTLENTTGSDAQRNAAIPEAPNRMGASLAVAARCVLGGSREHRTHRWLTTRWTAFQHAHRKGTSTSFGTRCRHPCRYAVTHSTGCTYDLADSIVAALQHDRICPPRLFEQGVATGHCIDLKESARFRRSRALSLVPTILPTPRRLAALPVVASRCSS